MVNYDYNIQLQIYRIYIYTCIYTLFTYMYIYICTQLQRITVDLFRKHSSCCGAVNDQYFGNAWQTALSVVDESGWILGDIPTQDLYIYIYIDIIYVIVLYMLYTIYIYIVCITSIYIYILDFREVDSASVLDSFGKLTFPKCVKEKTCNVQCGAPKRQKLVYHPMSIINHSYPQLWYL